MKKPTAAQLKRAEREGWSDWIVGPADRLAVAEGCTFDIDAAERARGFFRCLRHGTGKFRGQPFELLDWQYHDVIGPLFGWKRPDGTRRFRRAFVSCAKKQGKSTMTAGLALYLLLADGEPTPEVYSFASEREQAGIIYREAEKMIDVTPGLRKVVTTRPSNKRVISNADRGFFASMSAEASSKEGLNASGIVVDELHAQGGRELWDALVYAGEARRQPLLIAITTAGDASDPQHVCRLEYEYAKGVQSGRNHDTAYLTAIYEADENDDWLDPATWAKANPSLGVTVSEEGLRRAAEEAKASPAMVNAFLRYRCNRWVASATAWLSPDLLDALPTEANVDDLEGADAWLGIDLSATDDLTAAVVFVPPGDGRDTFAVLPQFFLPEDNIERLARKHRVPYAAWQRAGYITLTPGDVVDYAFIRQHVRQLAERFRIRQVGFDRLFQGQQLESELIEDGFDVVPVGQGWGSQARPLAEIDRAVKSRCLDFGGHPVMRWNLGNAVAKADDAGNLSLSKRLSRSKVDGVAALVNAMFCWLAGQGPDRDAEVNWYADEESPELIVLDF
ncbi:MAG: terminase TerL endonuclease subunit [Planctomycetota bacterium]